MFRTYHWPIFVVEPNSDKLCWLYQAAKKTHKFKTASLSMTT
ncbi:DUF1887 family CARF protein [Vibrio lentus]|nr:DUF1887 family CARF protein [Vibrio lentus]